ncbi:DUF975 family protein [Lacticaseibacillus salsurivasis]|uniref:DUF975 family protein n=1 Tax=Lacticaseibacillus salsurivasis TaxID=3081441 RepID=UPI0030C66CCA
MNRAQLKAQAKARLSGKWGWALVLVLVGTIFASLIGGITVGILELMTLVGLNFSFLRLIDDDDQGHGLFNNIFSGFTGPRPMAVFLNTLLTSIFTALWGLLLVIPGVVKALAYAQVPYILADMQQAGAEIGATDAITASRQLMQGHKWEYFVLQLSFVGWGLLAVLTAGIGFLWLSPYIQATNAAYYRQLAGDRFLNDDADFSDF